MDTDASGAGCDWDGHHRSDLSLPQAIFTIDYVLKLRERPLTPPPSPLHEALLAEGSGGAGGWPTEGSGSWGAEAGGGVPPPLGLGAQAMVEGARGAEWNAHPLTPPPGGLGKQAMAEGAMLMEATEGMQEKRAQGPPDCAPPPHMLAMQVQGAHWAAAGGYGPPLPPPDYPCLSCSFP